MKRLFSAIILSTVLTASTFAQMTLGYCSEEVSSGSLSNSKTDVSLSCAIGLTPELQSQYVSLCGITYLHIGLLAPEQFTSFSIWARRALSDTVDITRAEIDPSTLTAGWNDILLPDTLLLSADSMLYIGFDYTQSKKTLMASSGAKTSEAAWMAVNGKWKDYSANTRPHCIAAGLCGLHHTVVGLSDIYLDRRSQISGSDSITITGEIFTLGHRPLSAFRIGYNDGRNPRVMCDYKCNTPVPFGQRASFSLTLEPTGWRYETERYDIPLVITVQAPDTLGQFCNTPTDTTGVIYLHASDTLYYEVGNLAPDEVNRNVLVEHFTSERSGFAPIGFRSLYKLQQQANLIPDRTRLIIISHHEGFGPADAWHVSVNSDYSPSLFGTDQLAFAPALLFNRVGTPVSATLPVDTLLRCIEESRTKMLFSFKKPQATYDNNWLEISLPIQLWSATALHNPRIVLCIVQDETTSVAQKNYYPERYNDDTQSNVIRHYLKSLDGDGSLYPGADMDAISSGHARISDHFTSVAGEECLTQNLHFGVNLTESFIALPNLHLVAYIYDYKATGEVVAVDEWMLKDCLTE